MRSPRRELSERRRQFPQCERDLRAGEMRGLVWSCYGWRRVGIGLVVVDPVFAAGFYRVGAADRCYLEGVDAGGGTSGTEAEDVVVGDVVGEGDEGGL